eukprot:5279406-Alexandrium_andersonii.AAC.1
MSASLVGSEMCIRDRGRRGETYNGGGYVHGNWHEMAITRAHSVSSWAGPVSYTHLTLPTICSV